MRNALKRSLSLLLALVMVVSMTLPASAAAEETTLDKIYAMLEYMNGLNEADYTADSWAEMVEVRDSVEAPEETPERLQQAVLDMLQEAVDGLVEREETTLDKIYAMLEYMNSLNEEDYTADSWAEMVEVRDSVEAPEETPEWLQQGVLDMLQAAVDGLVEREETTLDKIYAMLEYMNSLNEEDYTADSWAEMVEVRDSVEAPEETPERLQQAVLDMLQAAVDGLVKKEILRRELF